MAQLAQCSKRLSMKGWRKLPLSCLIAQTRTIVALLVFQKESWTITTQAVSPSLSHWRRSQRRETLLVEATTNWVVKVARIVGLTPPVNSQSQGTQIRQVFSQTLLSRWKAIRSNELPICLKMLQRKITPCHLKARWRVTYKLERRAQEINGSKTRMENLPSIRPFTFSRSSRITCRAPNQTTKYYRETWWVKQVRTRYSSKSL